MLSSPSRLDNVYHVVTADHVSASAVLDGFVITGGDANDLGGGLRVVDATPTVSRCLFSLNTGVSGGAVGVTGGGVPTFVSCIFTGNVADAAGGAVYVGSNSSATMTGCTLTAFVQAVRMQHARVLLAAGEVAGRINDIPTVKELVDGIMADAEEIVGNLAAKFIRD